MLSYMPRWPRPTKIAIDAISAHSESRIALFQVTDEYGILEGDHRLAEVCSLQRIAGCIGQAFPRDQRLSAADGGSLE